METQPEGVFTAVQLSLPEGQMLIANQEQRILSLLDLRRSSQPLLAQQHFSANEWKVLLVLLQAFPSHASYAELAAALFGHAPESVANHGETMGHPPREELRPVREIVSNLRLKMRPFGLEITANHDLGYEITIPETNRRGTWNSQPWKA